MNLFAVLLKLQQYCKPTRLHLKKKKQTWKALFAVREKSLAMAYWEFYIQLELLAFPFRYDGMTGPTLALSR